MATQDAVQSARQLQTVWRWFVEDRGTGDVGETSTLATRWADSGFPFWNTLNNTKVDATRDDAAAMLQQAAAYMRTKKEIGFLWLFEDLLEPEARGNLPQLAASAGLHLAFPGYGMTCDLQSLREPPTHPDLVFIRVRTESEVMAYGAVNCAAYGFDAEALKAGFDSAGIWLRDDVHAYLGLKNGVPVTAAATLAANDSLFVILVATLPDHHRKGYGEAVTRKALYEGARATGLRRADLHATLAGAPVYERIGFQKIASIGFYGLTSVGQETQEGES